MNVEPGITAEASVLVIASIIVIKYHDQKQLQNRVYFNSHLVVHHPGKSEQELKSGTQRQELLTGLVQKASSALPRGQSGEGILSIVDDKVSSN